MQGIHRSIHPPSNHFWVSLVLGVVCFWLVSCEPSTMHAGITPTAVENTPNAQCLIGSWQISDLSPLINSFDNLDMADSPVQIKEMQQSGTLTLTFGTDGQATLSAAQFNQTYTIASVVGGRKNEIPVSLLADGSNSAQYSINAKKIIFSGQQNQKMIFNVKVFEVSQDFKDELLGSGKAQKEYKFHCVDADHLTLTALIPDVPIAPLHLTRLP